MTLDKLGNELLTIGVGRRKAAIAIVQVYKINSVNSEKPYLIINDCFGEVFMQFNLTYLNYLKLSLNLLNLQNSYIIKVKTYGGGLNGQAGATALGLARALCKLDPNYRKILKGAGLLRRDSRNVERKKYGLKKARKASQYSKR